MASNVMQRKNGCQNFDFKYIFKTPYMFELVIASIKTLELQSVARNVELHQNFWRFFVGIARNLRKDDRTSAQKALMQVH